MSYADPKTNPGRRRRRPAHLAVEGLEGRQLLSATPSLPTAQFQALEAAHPYYFAALAAREARAEARLAAKAGAQPLRHFSQVLPTLPVRASASSSLTSTPGQPVSIVGTPVGHPPIFVTNHPKSAAGFLPPTSAYGPQQVATAYGVTQLGLANQGQGVTVGIYEALDDSSLGSDLNAFSSYYGLPQFNAGVTGSPTFTVVKDTTYGNVPASAKNEGNNDTSIEASLDVEYVHAMAPLANIVVVETPNSLNALFHGVQVAAGTTGVVAVSTSYGTNEFSGGTSYDTFGTGAASKVALTVSTGDSNFASYPATSSGVIAVGGTALYLGGLRGGYGFETAWGGTNENGAGGGGVSTQYSAPTYQTSNNVNYSGRAVPDISAIADPYTGVAVYDSYDQAANGNDPWVQIGGTSLASPVVAGILALAQQDRLAAGKAILNSTQIDTALYNAYNSSSYSTYFNDVTTGTNLDGSGSSFSATTGYDLATGIGSPKAGKLVPYLASI